ncbi:MAG: hypothetical protein LBI13_04945 [Streptococcaceae bacterium]|nr:hypothetical protein [Streptococcaceae bacterium]
MTNLSAEVIQHLEKYTIPENFFYEKASLVYLTAKYDYLTGKPEALVTMKAHLVALELYGCSGTAALCRKEIEELVNNPEAKGLVPYNREDKGK